MGTAVVDYWGKTRHKQFITAALGIWTWEYGYKTLSRTTSTLCVRMIRFRPSILTFKFETCDDETNFVLPNIYAQTRFVSGYCIIVQVIQSLP